MMTHAFAMAVWGAALTAMVSAGFGAGMARLVWAGDLKQARAIDAIRSRTELALRDQIAALERQIVILKQSK